jgi:hypothetical protein
VRRSIARSVPQTGDESKARVERQIINNCKGELAAEALYYDGYFKIKMGSLKLQT